MDKNLNMMDQSKILICKECICHNEKINFLMKVNLFVCMNDADYARLMVILIFLVILQA